MTAMTAEPIEAVDLSDLDLLNDDHSHYQCMVCTGDAQIIGHPFIAWCGRQAIRWERLPKGQAPADLCPDCARPGPCATCGTWDA